MLRARRAQLFFSCMFVLFGVLTPLVIAHEAHHGSSDASSVDADAFLRGNQAAMAKMMNDMAARPTGDIDRDFVAMMVPHHQGAIDMAVLELRYGKNEQLRRIAQEIVVDQTGEIAAMKLAVGQPSTVSAPAPTQPGLDPAGQPRK